MAGARAALAKASRLRSSACGASLSAMKRSGRTSTPPSRWLLAQSRKDLVAALQRQRRAIGGGGIDGDQACAKPVEDGAVAVRQGGGRIGADAEHKPLMAAEPSCRAAGHRRRTKRRAAAASGRSAASRPTPVNALREIPGGGSTPPRRTNARKPLDRLSSANTVSRRPATTRLVGMMTAPSRRDTFTMLRTLCARSIS